MWTYFLAGSHNGEVSLTCGPIQHDEEEATNSIRNSPPPYRIRRPIVDARDHNNNIPPQDNSNLILIDDTDEYPRAAYTQAPPQQGSNQGGRLDNSISRQSPPEVQQNQGTQNRYNPNQVPPGSIKQGSNVYVLKKNSEVVQSSDNVVVGDISKEQKPADSVKSAEKNENEIVKNPDDFATYDFNEMQGSFASYSINTGKGLCKYIHEHLTFFLHI